VLKTHEKELHALAKELLDKETLTGAQIRELLVKTGGRGAAAAAAAAS
jgi:ATP-dependent metalloprotease